MHAKEEKLSGQYEYERTIEWKGIDGNTTRTYTTPAGVKRRGVCIPTTSVQAVPIEVLEVSILMMGPGTDEALVVEYPPVTNHAPFNRPATAPYRAEGLRRHAKITTQQKHRRKQTYARCVCAKERRET